ncbi:MAG TPA: hypothetical protein PK176_10660 [Acidobacteriota bacterium]|nr:hypothetical protein [Acidobacteriota bacterium]HQM63763.1 hypothetical protein [Acidobacteriota bacterium]
MQPLEKFGLFIVKNLRDKAIRQHLLMQRGHWRAKAIQELQNQVVALTPDLKDLLLRVVVDVVDTAMHDILAAFQEAHDSDEGIDLIVDNVNIAEVSGMLQGEHLGESGWIEKFSEFAVKGPNP